MHKTLISGSLALGIGMGAPGIFVPGALAEPGEVQHGAPTAWIPESNRHPAEEVGLTAHTNLHGLSLADKKGAQRQGAPYSGYYYETPASLACVYGLNTTYAPN